MSRLTTIPSRSSSPNRNAPVRRPMVLPNFSKGSLQMGGNTVTTFIKPSSITPLTAIGTSGSFSCGALVNLFPKFTWASSDNDNHAICTAGFNYSTSLGYTFQVDLRGYLVLIAGQNFYYSPSGVVPTSTWVWIIFVMSGATITGYVNGIQVWQSTSVTRVNSSQLAGDNNFFGTEASGTGSARRIKGNLSITFSASSPLTQSQVNDIVFANKFPSVDILYYCNEGSGSTVYDKSGNANNGSLTTGVWSSSGPSLASATRINLDTNPSFESNNIFLSSGGTAGSTVGLTHNDRDTTNILSRSYSALIQQNFSSGSNTGQYFINTNNPFSPIMGHTYTFSAYIYIATGTTATSIAISIRDYSTYNYIRHNTYTLSAGQWTRISTKALATSVYTTWRFTIADAIAVGYTGIISYWIDNLLIEDNDQLDTFFDGTTGNASWAGTTDQSTSQLLLSRRISW